MYFLARRSNIDPDEMFSLNGLTGYFLALPGDKVKIPHTGNTYKGNHSLRTHTPNMLYLVKAGDTVYRIACYFGDVDPNAIITANNLQLLYALTIGSTIIIP